MSARSPLPDSGFPRVDIIVPVYNEEAMIDDKLDNVCQLAYPARCLRIIVVDGWSEDGTASRVTRWARAHDLRVDLVRTTAFGKPAQLNVGLAHATTEWVLVTDADARLAPCALASMVERTRADPRVGVVGAEVQPARGHPLDRAHWAAANWLLRLERRLGTAGLVVGPCYLLKRELFAPFPSGTVSDDVHVSCRALLAGVRIEVAAETVVELRTPERGRDLFRHKVRKARGYLHEVRATLPAIRRVDAVTLAVFVWRAALLLLPPAVLVGAALTLGVTGGWEYVLGSAAVLALVAAAFLKSRPRRTARPGVLTTWLGLPLITAAVLLAAICARPFTSVSARYPRLKSQPSHEATP